jgi:DNA-binding FadR family transcriptional regulator
MIDQNSSSKLSGFLQYLAAQCRRDSGRLPALTDLSRELGISVATLREQLEVARALGLVEVRPKTGIRAVPYTFQPAVRQSLAYALAIDGENFQYFSDLRNHIESVYWFHAVSCLTESDKQRLRHLVSQALDRLNSTPIQIPHFEHRELHLSIFRRLNNPFVIGILEAYWEAYEQVGLSYYSDFEYVKNVWKYHQKMVDAIVSGDYSSGHQALVEHLNLISLRAKPNTSQKFE